MGERHAATWAGSGGTDPVGLTVVAKTPFVLGGTNLYAWKPGGRFVVTLDFHNSASVPVTITGVDSTPRDGWVGAFSGPTLQNASADSLQPVAGRFHSVRVPADGYRALAIVFHANSNPKMGCGTTHIERLRDASVHHPRDLPQHPGDPAGGRRLLPHQALLSQPSMANARTGKVPMPAIGGGTA